jgi:hypothetical protein
MKSDPGTPLIRDNSFGGTASAAASRVGGITRERSADALAKECDVLLAMRGATAVAALASAAEARNLRLLTARRRCRGGFLALMNIPPVFKK